MILSHIVAVSKNFVIGKNNRLPWKMPDDLQYFHDITMGHVVIMGRKNYQANKKALKGRTNIVISRSQNFHPPDAILVHSVEEAIDLAKKMGESEAFIVGGGEIYKLTLAIVKRIYITVIDTVVDGDTVYPEINFGDYEIISKKEFNADKKNPHDWVYWVLGRKIA